MSIAALAVIGLGTGGCNGSAPKGEASVAVPSAGRILIAITVDWEGAYFSPEGLDALDGLRDKLGAAPLTHFVSAAYFTKVAPAETGVTDLTASIRPGDELGLHLHGWASLATEAGVRPRLSPSFLTGTDRLIQFPDGDVGFDVDLDVYEVNELRAMIRTSKQRLEAIGLRVSTSFRAGGYLGTPKLLHAIRAEGFEIDSSATHADQFKSPKDKVFRERVGEVWPALAPEAAPYVITTPAGAVLEIPIAAIVDYVDAKAIYLAISRAHETLARAPAADVAVVIALHQENADEFAGRLVEALDKGRAGPGLSSLLEFTTISGIAHRDRADATSAGPPWPAPRR